MSKQLRPRVRQVAGVAAIDAALRAGADVRLLLVADDARSDELAALLTRAAKAGAAVRTATRNVIARLSAVRPAEDVLALVGRDPEADLAGSLARGGAFWLLVGVAYPGNVGMVIRTAEVSGADGIAIEGAFDHEGKRAALRASMRADKFMPVFWTDAQAVLDAARASAARHRLVALDESGGARALRRGAGRRARVRGRRRERRHPVTAPGALRRAHSRADGRLHPLLQPAGGRVGGGGGAPEAARIVAVAMSDFLEVPHGGPAGERQEGALLSIEGDGGGAPHR